MSEHEQAALHPLLPARNDHPTEETPMTEPNQEAYEQLLAARVDPEPCPVDGCNLTGPLPHDHDWTASGESRAAEYLS